MPPTQALHFSEEYLKIIFMKTTSAFVGLKELRVDTERYIAEVRRGKSFTVLRRSRPVFKISPPDSMGDEGVWTDLDLRDSHGRGMSPDALIRIIKKFNESHR